MVFPGDFQAWMLAMQQFWTYLVDTWAGQSTFSFYRTCTIECTWSTVDCATMYGNDVLADLPFEWVSKVKECTHSVGWSPSEEMMKLQFPVLNLAYCISRYNDVHCTIKNIHPLPHDGAVTKLVNGSSPDCETRTVPSPSCFQCVPLPVDPTGALWLASALWSAGDKNLI